MKAAVYYNYGNPDVIQIKDVPKPNPKENEVLIRVHASTVNRTDCANLTAKPFIMRLMNGLTKPKKPILGTDFAGEVKAVGKSVKKYKIGDKVFGFNDSGLESHAEYIVMTEEGDLEFMPNNRSFAEAAASIEGFHYALNFVNKVEIKKGDKILVNGGTGAIGSAAVQICKYYGTKVTAVCGSEYADKVKAIGAERIIDYTKEDYTKDSERYDFVFDAVGKNTFGKSKQVLKSQGIYISSELGPFIQNAYLPLITPLFSKKIVRFPMPINIKASLELSKRMNEEEKFNALIDREYPIDKSAEAFTYVLTGKKIGNVVLNI